MWAAGAAEAGRREVMRTAKRGGNAPAVTRIYEKRRSARCCGAMCAHTVWGGPTLTTSTRAVMV